MAFKISEAVVVEGKYDGARLREIVDTVVVETGGFSLFHDKQKQRLLRELAAKRGLIVLTDSDSAGFVIRDFISGLLPKTQVKHAYIPECAGKERRKPKPSAEGLLGVEGMGADVIVHSLLRAGATTETNAVPQPPFLTKARLYEDGLAGNDNSAAKRERLLSALGLPRKLSANRMMDVVNALLSEDEYEALLTKVAQ